MSDFNKQPLNENDSTEPIHKQDFQENGKGMNPVSNHVMINFLHWTQRYHPEVRNLAQLPENELFQLVNEYTGGRFTWQEWRAGFSLLQEGRTNRKLYVDVRETLRDLGL